MEHLLISTLYTYLKQNPSMCDPLNTHTHRTFCSKTVFLHLWVVCSEVETFMYTCKIKAPLDINSKMRVDCSQQSHFFVLQKLQYYRVIALHNARINFIHLL